MTDETYQRVAGKYTYYLDESGNTGDITGARPAFTFGGQPYFVLSCVGGQGFANLEQAWTALRKAHSIKADEIKFGSVKRKPKFVADLLDLLASEGSILFIEAVDKRFVLIAHIIECLIVPPVHAGDYGPEARMVKNVFADRLASTLPTDVLNAFSSACSTRHHSDIENAFRKLEKWIDTQPEDQVMNGIRLFLSETLSNFREIEPNDRKALDHYLPVPDKARSGKTIQILPHVSSLIGIYSRLNRYHNGSLRQVCLIHDEQAQFDAALLEGMALAESNIAAEHPKQPIGNFHFSEAASLSFETSTGSIGVQVADVLAGTVSFLLQTITNSQGKLPPGWSVVLEKLLRFDDPMQGTGTNLVVPTYVTRAFHTQPT